MYLWLKPHSDGVIFSSNLNQEPAITPLEDGNIDWVSLHPGANYTHDSRDRNRVHTDGNHQVSYHYALNAGAFEIGHSTGFVFLHDTEVAEVIDYFQWALITV